MSQKRVHNKLPKEVIDHWPEIFEDVEIRAIPLEYLYGIDVHFKDGRQWSIDLKRNNGSTIDEVEESLAEFFEEYDEAIERVEFHLNTLKVKEDIEKRTKSFMKRRR